MVPGCQKLSNGWRLISRTMVTEVTDKIPILVAKGKGIFVGSFLYFASVVHIINWMLNRKLNFHE